MHLWLLTKGVDTSIPFLPLSTISIAVAYAGFKNSQSKDRFWKAGKVWGGMVNYSRTLANQVMAYVSNQHATAALSLAALGTIQQELIYRHWPG